MVLGVVVVELEPEEAGAGVVVVLPAGGELVVLVPEPEPLGVDPLELPALGLVAGVVLSSWMLITGEGSLGNWI